MTDEIDEITNRSGKPLSTLQVIGRFGRLPGHMTTTHSGGSDHD